MRSGVVAPPHCASGWRSFLAAAALASPPDSATRPASLQASITLYAAADATVKSQFPTTNFGAEHYPRLAYSSMDVPIEDAVILRFDLSGRPAGAIVDSASLEWWSIIPPTANLYFPTDGAAVSGDQRILVLIHDDVGIQTVQFLLNDSTLDSFNYPSTPSTIEFSGPGWW